MKSPYRRINNLYVRIKNLYLRINNLNLRINNLFSKGKWPLSKDKYCNRHLRINNLYLSSVADPERLWWGNLLFDFFNTRSHRVNYETIKNGTFIPDPDFYPFRIPDLGSRIQKQQQKRGVKKNLLSKPFFVATNFTKLKIILFFKCWRKNLGQFSKNYRTFFTKICHKALKSMGLGSGIRKKTYSGSRVKKASDPGSGSATLYLRINNLYLRINNLYLRINHIFLLAGEGILLEHGIQHPEPNLYLRINSLYPKIKNLYPKINNLYLRINNLDRRINHLYPRINNLYLGINNLYLRINNLYLRINNLYLRINNLYRRRRNPSGTWRPTSWT